MIYSVFDSEGRAREMPDEHGVLMSICEKLAGITDAEDMSEMDASEFKDNAGVIFSCIQQARNALWCFGDDEVDE